MTHNAVSAVHFDHQGLCLALFLASFTASAQPDHCHHATAAKWRRGNVMAATFPSLTTGDVVKQYEGSDPTVAAALRDYNVEPTLGAWV